MSRENDFFASDEGSIQSTGWRRYWKLLRLADAATDLRCALALKRAGKLASMMPSQNILLTAVRTRGREADLDAVIKKMSSTKRHKLDISVVDMKPKGKFDNINDAISNHELSRYDWLIVIDDDIEFSADFLDLFIYFAFRNHLKLAMPAHRFLSYTSFRVTERHWSSLVRETSFVEIGPVSLLHRDTFSDLLPSPSLRWSWGLDVFWSHMARKRNWNIGVVDATPIRHTRPVGSSYDGDAARNEAVEFLNLRGIPFNRAIVSSMGKRLQ